MCNVEELKGRRKCESKSSEVRSQAWMLMITVPRVEPNG